MQWWNLTRFKITNPREKERMLKNWSQSGKSKFVPIVAYALRDPDPSVRRARYDLSVRRSRCSLDIRCTHVSERRNRQALRRALG